MFGRLFDVSRSIPSTERSEIDRCAAITARARKSSAMTPSSSTPDSRPRQGMDYGESEEVQNVHAAIQREKREPRVGLEGLQGPMKVKGQQFGTAVMQPWDKTFTDQKIADVLTYERSDWGNKASPVTPEQIAALRKELASHPESFTEKDILAVPDED